MIIVGSPKARLRLLVFIALAAIVVGLGDFTLWNGVKSVVQLVSGRILPIYCVETPEKKVAISFDATWGADLTPEILSILRENKVKTTFFLAGYWLEKYPEMVKEISDEGHELGNHSYSHPHCNSLSPIELKHELEQTHSLIKSISGQDSHLFRPPFGEYNNTVVTTAKEMDYETIMWDVDSLDWKDLSADDIVQRVMSRVKPGSIVLFHNAGKNTPAAVRTIIKMLRADGYDIVPISKVLIKGETYIDHTGKQKSKEPKPNDEDGKAKNPQLSREGGPGFEAVKAVIAKGLSQVVTEAGNPAIYKGNSERKEMAFAMNVAWGEEYIPRILDELAKADTKITFYFVGTWVKMFPDITKKIAQEGHEIANHGYTHSHPTQLAQTELEQMIVKNYELLKDTTGEEPSKLFSPPYGELNQKITDTAANLGFTTTMWTSDTIDWQRPPASTIVERVVSKAENGAIILMHPTAPTLEALPEMIKQLRDKGYKVVPVSKLLG